MDSLGINFALLFIQLIFMIALIGFPVFSLLDLKKKRMTGTTLAIWVLIICAIPLIGPLAYWIIKPSAQ